MAPAKNLIVRNWLAASVSPAPSARFLLPILNDLLGEIESTLQRMGRAEVPSRIVGDMVINGLKNLDLIAYIRYAIVYLHLDDLESIRGEIDRLLED